MDKHAHPVMCSLPHPSVKELQRRAHHQLVSSAFIVALVTAIALLLDAALGNTGILIGMVGIGGIVVAGALSAWLWQNPVRGLYVLFAAAAAVDVDYSDTTHDGYYIAHYLPFWQDITAWTGAHVIFSLAETFMALALVVWLLKVIATRDFQFAKGTLLLPLGLYGAMILVGETHGVASGGNVTKSLWELRAQIYMVLAYIFTCNLIRTRQGITTLVGILLAGAGFRAVEGSFRYFIYFRGRVLQEINVFPHEQAFFLNAFITMTAVLVFYGGPPKLKRMAIWLLPFVVFIDLATQRRAAVLALGVGMTLLLLVTLVVHPARRRSVRIILLLLALAFPPYYLKYQYSYGTIGGPARAIASNFHPDSRDASSNQYRIDETFDIMSTMRTSPVIGYGFGKPMLTPVPLPDISQIYIFWNYMPHNSILWVFMRLGTIGYLLLWFMVGGAIVQATGLLRRLRDPWFQGIMLFIVLMIVQEVIFGYLDLAWTNDRNLFAIGVLFALISCIGRIAAIERGLSPIDERMSPQDQSGASSSVFASMAVVNGRLQSVDAQGHESAPRI